MKSQLLNFKVFIFLSLVSCLLSLAVVPVYAGHGNNDIGKTYCDSSTNTVWINEPNDVHTNTKTSCAVQSVFGRINPPPQVASIGYGAKGLSTFLTNIIILIFGISGILFLFMIVIGALQWITSGGSKEAIDGARKRITQAIVGIVLLSLAFTIAKFVGDLTGFTFFKIGP